MQPLILEINDKVCISFSCVIPPDAITGWIECWLAFLSKEILGPCNIPSVAMSVTIILSRGKLLHFLIKSVRKVFDFSIQP